MDIINSRRLGWLGWLDQAKFSQDISNNNFQRRYKVSSTKVVVCMLCLKVTSTGTNFSRLYLDLPVVACELPRCLVITPSKRADSGSGWTGSGPVSAVGWQPALGFRIISDLAMFPHWFTVIVIALDEPVSAGPRNESDNSLAVELKLICCLDNIDVPLTVIVAALGLQMTPPSQITVLERQAPWLPAG